jgi:hypothetical protein
VPTGQTKQAGLCILCFAKKHINFPKNHLPQTWKSVYVVIFEASEESEFVPISAKIFLGTWNINNNTIKYNVCKVIQF